VDRANHRRGPFQRPGPLSASSVSWPSIPGPGPIPVETSSLREIAGIWRTDDHRTGGDVPPRSACVSNVWFVPPPTDRNRGAPIAGLGRAVHGGRHRLVPRVSGTVEVPMPVTVCNLLGVRDSRGVRGRESDRRTTQSPCFPCSRVVFVPRRPTSLAPLGDSGFGRQSPVETTNCYAAERGDTTPRRSRAVLETTRPSTITGGVVPVRVDPEPRRTGGRTTTSRARPHPAPGSARRPYCGRAPGSAGGRT